MKSETFKDGPLSAQQIAAFRRDGYLAFDPGVPEATLAGVVQDLSSAWGRRAPGSGDGVYRKARIQDAWRFSEHVRELALSPGVLAALGQIYSRRPQPFQTLNFNTGTEQPAHADTLHFNSVPAGYMCGVWIALEDIDLDNGPLVYYPGSHVLPEVTLHDLGPEVERLCSVWTRLERVVMRGILPSARRNEIYGAFYEPHMAEIVRRENLQPRYGTIRKGQAIIWAANLIHGGAPQKDKSRSRHSQVTHYFFEGCEYYTPLMQTTGVFGEKHTMWRKPAWIR